MSARQFRQKCSISLAVHYTGGKDLQPFGPSTTLGPWGSSRQNGVGDREALAFFTEL